jgi:predicted transcriptional regulator
MRFTSITINRIEYRPVTTPDMNDELQYLGGCLGLFNLRDKDKSRFRIFIALLKALKSNEGMSSDDLASRLDLSRATVIHHLKNLMDAGIVEEVRGRYQLRVDTLEELLEAVRVDIDKTIDDLKEVARNIDKELGLNAPRKQVKNRTPF